MPRYRVCNNLIYYYIYFIGVYCCLLLFVVIGIRCGCFIVGFKYLFHILKTFSNIQYLGVQSQFEIGEGEGYYIISPSPQYNNFSKKFQKNFKNYNHYNFFTYLFAFVIYFTYLCAQIGLLLLQTSPISKCGSEVGL